MDLGYTAPFYNARHALQLTCTTFYVRQETDMASAMHVTEGYFKTMCGLRSLKFHLLYKLFFKK
jgi:hypothetical protein